MTAFKEDKVDIEYLRSLPIVGKQPASTREEEFLKEVCEFEFMNIKEPGVMHTFSYGNTKRSHNFKFMHGATYKVPRFIARHLESCCTPIYEWRPDGMGRMTKRYTGNDPRFQMRQVYNAG